MICTECPVDDLLFVQPHDRPAGVHVSDILGDILRRMDPARYDKKDRSGRRAPIDKQKIQAGINFEERLERLLVQAHAVPGLFRPNPIQKDGIWGSPDGIDPGLWCPVEYKLTWYSEKKVFPDDPVYWPYLVQVKAYDYLIESLKAVMWIQHVNGDYAPPKPGKPRKYVLEFQPIEIQENWSMLKGHAKSLGWL